MKRRNTGSLLGSMVCAREKMKIMEKELVRSW